MPWYLILTVAFLGLGAALASGMPIALGLGLTGLAGLVSVLGWDPSLVKLGMQPYGELANIIWVTVPLYIFMAQVILESGISADLFDASQRWLSRLPGGLAMSVQAACVGFGAVCGSSTATAAAVGGVAISEMERRGYPRRLAAGSVAAGGGLAILIPPSIPLIVYGVVTETSIGKLFLAGIVPGLLLAALNMAYIAWTASRDPRLAPSLAVVSWKQRTASLSKVWPVLALAVLVLTAIYSGLSTVTEAAGLGALGALLLAALYRRLTWRNLASALSQSADVTGSLAFIILGALLFGLFLTVAQAPQGLLAWIESLEVNRWLVMAAINVLLLLAGCFLEVGTITLVILPILFPIVHALGFDPVWFGAVFALNVEIGFLTPPVGLNLFVLKSSTGIPFSDIVWGTIPFVLVALVVLGLVIAFPQLALFLPERFG